MGTSKVLIPFFLISVLFLTIVVVFSFEDNCARYTMCAKNEPVIQFPFSLRGYQQEHRCGYPGFDLSCNKMNTTVVRLGSWGEFFVREIDYAAQEVQIYDQHDCLPKRLLNLNLSGSPFKGAYYQQFYFFNCSSNNTPDYLEPITCLSTLNQSIYATSSDILSRYMAKACHLFAIVSVPTPWPVYEQGYSADINNNLHLIWGEPNCRDCVVEGGKCGFKNNAATTELACVNLPRRGLPRSVNYVLIIGVGTLALFSAILIGCYIYARLKYYGGNTNNQQQQQQDHHRHVESSSLVLPQLTLTVAAGLDESVIQSYPETVLGESRRLAKPDDSTCSICLSEYSPKETLRTIPACKHCFHASCIDEWLRRNATCPLCRNSPISVSSSV